MKILAFGGSYSKNSINKEFAFYTAENFDGAEIEKIDLNDFQLPLYTIDLEKEEGIPASAHSFLSKISDADLIIISLAEHNGSYTAGFKNLFDWISRINVKMFDAKHLFLLSTATGPGGGISVMEAATKRFPKHGANIISTFTLPKFQDNFDQNNGILNSELAMEFQSQLEILRNHFSL
jgi:NAD(P)H-dependent FMN reductase